MKEFGDILTAIMVVCWISSVRGCWSYMRLGKVLGGRNSHAFDDSFDACMRILL